MKPSQACLDLIKAYEGLRLEAYRDVGGVLTVGYGYTGPEVTPQTVWTEAQANFALVSRANAIGSIVTGCVVPVLRQGQLDALVCLCYNIGQAAFRGSTLLKAVNQRGKDRVAEEWVKWDHVDGKVVAGLLRRREAELMLFQG